MIRCSWPKKLHQKILTLKSFKLFYFQDDDMGKIGGFLGTTVTRLKRLARQGYGKLYLYLALFSLAVFFVMYILIRFS